jgi:peptide chain release factor 2
MSDPDFWSNPDAAKAKSQAFDELKKELATWDRLHDEIETLQALSNESKPEELESHLQALEAEFAKLEFTLMLSGPHDERNAVLAIHAGAGGTDAQDWADMLKRMFLRFCERKGWTTRILDESRGQEAGVKSVTIEIIGRYAYGYLRSEAGVHRLVRISPFDSNARRHTAFASVTAVPEIDDAVEVEIDEGDLRIDTYRASGAGGQHVNKTESAVRLTHLPTGVVAACQAERSQHKNKATAMKMLRAKLFELERRKQAEKLEELTGEKREIGFGSQIRSYTLHPQQRAKDHRTDLEIGNVDAVLDGDLDPFIRATLLAQAAELRPKRVGD